MSKREAPIYQPSQQQQQQGGRNAPLPSSSRPPPNTQAPPLPHIHPSSAHRRNLSNITATSSQLAAVRAQHHHKRNLSNTTSSLATPGGSGIIAPPTVPKRPTQPPMVPLPTPTGVGGGGSTSGQSQNRSRIREMEERLLQLLDDFTAGRLRAFGDPYVETNRSNINAQDSTVTTTDDISKSQDSSTSTTEKTSNHDDIIGPTFEKLHAVRSSQGQLSNLQFEYGMLTHSSSASMASPLASPKMENTPEPQSAAAHEIPFPSIEECNKSLENCQDTMLSVDQTKSLVSELSDLSTHIKSLRPSSNMTYPPQSINSRLPTF